MHQGLFYLFFCSVTVFRLRLQLYGPAVTIITLYFNRMFVPPVYVFIFWRQDNITPPVQ